jgi:hypothetical protein
MFPYKKDESRNITGNQGGAMSGTPGADNTDNSKIKTFSTLYRKAGWSKNALHCAYGKEVCNA